MECSRDRKPYNCKSKNFKDFHYYVFPKFRCRECGVIFTEPNDLSKERTEREDLISIDTYEGTIQTPKVDIIRNGLEIFLGIDTKEKRIKYTDIKKSIKIDVSRGRLPLYDKHNFERWLEDMCQETAIIMIKNTSISAITAVSRAYEKLKPGRPQVGGKRDYIIEECSGELEHDVKDKHESLRDRANEYLKQCKGVLTEEQIWILQQLRDGMTQDEVAKKLGIVKSSMSERLDTITKWIAKAKAEGRIEV